MSVVGSHVAPPHREEEYVFAPYDADFGGPESGLSVVVARFCGPCLLVERRAGALPGHQVVRVPDREQVGRVVEPERAVRVAQHRGVGTVPADDRVPINVRRDLLDIEIGRAADALHGEQHRIQKKRFVHF